MFYDMGNFLEMILKQKKSEKLWWGGGEVVVVVVVKGGGGIVRKPLGINESFRFHSCAALAMQGYKEIRPVGLAGKCSMSGDIRKAFVSKYGNK